MSVKDRIDPMQQVIDDMHRGHRIEAETRLKNAEAAKMEAEAALVKARAMMIEAQAKQIMARGTAGGVKHKDGPGNFLDQGFQYTGKLPSG